MTTQTHTNEPGDLMQVPTIDPIVITYTPSLELLKDIAITAAEGGIGYWSVCETWKWQESRLEAAARMNAAGEAWTPETLDGLRAELPFPVLVLSPDGDAEGDFPATVVTPETIRKGLQLYLTPGMHQRRDEHEIIKAIADGDCSYIDSECADVIVQLGMFGSIVYG